MNTTIILLFVLILFYVYVLYINPNNEYFMIYWSGPPVAHIAPIAPIDPLPNIDDHTDLPWWNTRIGQTTNMSYDLRGDPIQIPKYPFMWNYSTLTPIYNKL